MKRLWLTLVSEVVLVALDYLVKNIVISLKGAASIVVIPQIFNIAYVENRGCAWGMLQGKVWGLAVFGILALAFIIWKRKLIFGEGPFAVIIEILLCAGIVGNLFDRCFRGFVIDMFDFHWGIHHFPCFNLADSYICIAVGIMLLTALRKPTQ